MPLRLKLLLIALVAAVFPLAGWRFIVQMETALRESQERALMAAARTLATALPAVDPTLRAALVAPAAWLPRPVAGPRAFEPVPYWNQASSKWPPTDPPARRVVNQRP